MWEALKYQLTVLPALLEPAWVGAWRTATYDQGVRSELETVLKKVPAFAYSVVEAFPLMSLVRSKDIRLEGHIGIVAGYASVNQKPALLIRSGNTDKDEVQVIDPETAELLEIWAHMPRAHVMKVLSEQMRGKA